MNHLLKAVERCPLSLSVISVGNSPCLEAVYIEVQVNLPYDICLNLINVLITDFTLPKYGFVCAMV